MEAAKNYTGLSYAEIETWVQRAEKKNIIEGKTEFRQTEVYESLMYSMNYELCSDDKFGDYLYQMPAQNM